MGFDADEQEESRIATKEARQPFKAIGLFHIMSDQEAYFLIKISFSEPPLAM